MKATKTSKYTLATLYMRAAFMETSVNALVSFLYEDNNYNNSVDINRINELVKSIKLDLDIYEYTVREYVYRLEQEALQNS